MRTDYWQAAWDHTRVCDDLDVVMDLLGEIQRAAVRGTPTFLAIGKVRQVMCDAQGVAELECKWKGGTDDRPADR